MSGLGGLSPLSQLTVITEAVRVAWPIVVQVAQYLSGERSTISIDEPTKTAVALAAFEARRAAIKAKGE